jgi:hypothetical protein
VDHSVIAIVDNARLAPLAKPGIGQALGWSGFM